jgi:hypothetical protein
MEDRVFDSDKFISMVQMHPALWDNSNADYANKIKKDNGWRAVMSSMYGDEEMQNWDVQKKNKIGTLRNLLLRIIKWYFCTLGNIGKLVQIKYCYLLINI